MVTVFHDLQHKRHPEYFRWFDRPFWRFFLYWAARRSKAVIAISGATAADLRRFYPRLPESKIHIVPQAVDPFSPVFARGGVPSRSCWPFRRFIRTRTWTGCCARLRFSGGGVRISGW